MNLSWTSKSCCVGSEAVSFELLWAFYRNSFVYVSLSLCVWYDSFENALSLLERRACWLILPVSLKNGINTQNHEILSLYVTDSGGDSDFHVADWDDKKVRHTFIRKVSWRQLSWTDLVENYLLECCFWKTLGSLYRPVQGRSVFQTDTRLRNLCLHWKIKTTTTWSTGGNLYLKGLGIPTRKWNRVINKKYYCTSLNLGFFFFWFWIALFPKRLFQTPEFQETAAELSPLKYHGKQKAIWNWIPSFSFGWAWLVVSHLDLHPFYTG